MSNNDKKAELLGVPFGTASGRLRKILLFDAIGRLNERNCYRCGEFIEKLEDFSIEHKNSWMNSNDPKESFYSLENISYSHLICNVTSGTRPHKIYNTSTEKWAANSQRRRADPERRDKEHNGRLERRALGKKW